MAAICLCVSGSAFRSYRWNSYYRNVEAYRRIQRMQDLDVKSRITQRNKRFGARAMYADEEAGDMGWTPDLVDAPVSAGDGFSFEGGKYAGGASRAEEWEQRGSTVVCQLVPGQQSAGTAGDAPGPQLARDPIFGLPLGVASQTAGDGVSWFFVDTAADGSNTLPPSPSRFPPVALLHGLPSQGFSFRTVISSLQSTNLRCISPDWPGFGLSDKPQPGKDPGGFSYSMRDYASALQCFLADVPQTRVSIVAQGFFCVAAAELALSNPDLVHHLVFINPPITDGHAKLPGSLSAFTGPLIGEIFAQDPLRASDRLLLEVCCYEVEEQDAMVYRLPYLTSGNAGFALAAVCRGLQKDLKASVPRVRQALAAVAAHTNSGSGSSGSGSGSDGQPRATVIWGSKDKWLSFDGVTEACRKAGAELVVLGEVGHHGQEDYGEAVGEALKKALVTY